MERPETPNGTTTALEANLVGCRHCAHAWPLGTPRCARCGGRLISRDPHSLQRVWAWLAAGVICYIPANTEPMLLTKTLLQNDASTIVGGAIELFAHGSVMIAVVILIASVGIPVAKFLSIAFLALSIRRRDTMSPTSKHRLYHVVEDIGRWSMIDVFVVAILSSLVQFSAVATVTPGSASLAFALSVVFTMISAQSFDSRRIWDGIDNARPVT
ncbi:MAG: paraquat-inducible protein A [Paracoccaceae bacterium]